MLKISPSSAAGPGDAVWIDLLNPDDAEREQVARATKLDLPSKEDLGEIESSSRVYVEDGVLYLSTPVAVSTDCAPDGITTLGFVLSPKRLVTQRFAPVAALDRLVSAQASAAAPSAGEAFLKILEAIVDQSADSLEHASAQLDKISSSAFHREDGHSREGFAKASAKLHEALRKLGRLNDGLSHIRDTLLGFGRIAEFLLDTDEKKQFVDGDKRLHVIKSDVTSLNDYQTHLSNKVQFLLDATLGFINIQQNDIVKALTVVSVVGVPPVLIAGVYGMNFEHMPELHWPLGYPLALALIVISGLVPLVWFKWRDWI
ncbi:MAG: CorA family divalent cation transporter [Polyangiaceae bacterium]